MEGRSLLHNPIFQGVRYFKYLIVNFLCTIIIVTVTLVLA